MCLDEVLVLLLVWLGVGLWLCYSELCICVVLELEWLCLVWFYEFRLFVEICCVVWVYWEFVVYVGMVGLVLELWC